jgi:hypothetical protein
MATLKQIQANQLNAEKSTGPKTEEGKIVVSQNATKHGLLSSQTLLPWEKSCSLEEFRQNLIAELQPKGELEMLLIDRIASLIWRLRRACKIETAILAIEQYEADMKRAYIETNSYVKRAPSTFDTKPVKVKILDQQKYDEAVQKEAEVLSWKNGDDAILGRGFVKQAGNLATLHRYETTLERSLFKTLHELQRVQAMRLCVNVTPPIAVDIHGDGKDFP